MKEDTTALDLARKQIEEADKAIAEAYEVRMKAVEEVAKYKMTHGLPIYDGNREKALIERNGAYIQDPKIRGYYVNLMEEFFKESKKYQESMISGRLVSFAGVEGAFANIAAKQIFPDARLMPCDDFAQAYEKVVKGECESCVLPLENSYAGEVGQVMDLMFSGQLYVNAVYNLPVHQNLLVVPGTKMEDIKKVISHPQALKQCHGYIKEHGFTEEQATNTAVAAQTVAEAGDKSVAAIASRDTAELYGLEVLEQKINSSDANTTRFAVFSRASKNETEANNKFMLMFTVNNEVGALAKAVNIICAHGVNMRVLRSRPVKNVPWQYYFYVEAEGDHLSRDGQNMMRALKVCCEELKVAGHFSEEITLED